MFLHLGSDFLVNSKEMIGIFDLDRTTAGEKTKRFLQAAEQAGRVIDAADDLPKSFLVTTEYGETRVYLSSLSCGTLKKRMEEQGHV